MATEQQTRPRVEGDREREILEAALEVLVDVGYDRLTMDAVATAAKASKATLYRRWNDKATLVIDALLLDKEAPPSPDTGSLAGDLRAAFCGRNGLGGLMDERAVRILGSVLTAINRDPEFAEQHRKRFIEPKTAVGRAIYERAIARGEIPADLDVSLFAPALAGICLHRAFVMGEQLDEELVGKVIDLIIVPAATHQENEKP
jgi:AcrR family transcriptional regulator